MNAVCETTRICYSADMAVPEYLDLLGLPFVRGGRTIEEGLDCYGLAIEMFRRDGVRIPDFDSPGTLELMEALISAKSAEWRKVPLGTIKSIVTLRVEGLGAHVGYMIAPDRFIHTIKATGVTTERLTNGSIRPIASYVYE